VLKHGFTPSCGITSSIRSHTNWAIQCLSKARAVHQLHQQRLPPPVSAAIASTSGASVTQAHALALHTPSATITSPASPPSPMAGSASSNIASSITQTQASYTKAKRFYQRFSTESMTWSGVATIIALFITLAYTIYSWKFNQ